MRKGFVQLPMRETDAEVLKKFLAETEDSMTQEKAAEVAGVAQRTMSRWRARKLPSRLPTDVRRRIDDYLAGQPSEDGGGGANEEETGSAAWLAELAAARRALALQENAKAVRIEAEAALRRADAVILNGKAIEKEGDRAENNRSLQGPRFEVMELLGPDTNAVLAFLRDVAEELRLKRGEKIEAPPEGRAAG